MHTATATTEQQPPAPPRWDVTLGWEGEQALIVTVPTNMGAAVAGQRAFWAIASQSPLRDLATLHILDVQLVQEPTDG